MKGGYRYQKGAAFERDLVNKFWGAGWASMRAAGSGSARQPVPDVIAVKDGVVLVIECKTTTKDKLSLKQAVMGLKRFTYLSGARAYLGVRFHKKQARFYDICELLLEEKYTLSVKDDFLSFDALVGKQSRLGD